MDMLSTPSTVAEAASWLRDAAEQRSPIAPLRERLIIDRVGGDDLAYAIQEENTRVALRSGRRLVGRKIGLTSPAVQAQLGVDQPDYGMLFADMAVGDVEPIRSDRLISPKVEAEVALILGRDLEMERPTYADLIRAVDHVLPAIEIVDSRISDWNIRFFDTVADNASSGLFVLGGRPRLLREVDLALCAMQMVAKGEVMSQGSGRACLGHPLNAAIWLAEIMARRQRPLRAGDIVLTGALGPMVAVAAGTRYDVTIKGLGAVSALFT